MGYVRLQPGHDLPHLWCGCRRLQNRWLRPGPRGRTTASHWELSGSATCPVLRLAVSKTDLDAHWMTEGGPKTAESLSMSQGQGAKSKLGAQS